MKTKQQIKNKMHFSAMQGTSVYHQGFAAALRWVLGPMPPEKAVAFACPKCGACVLKIEPTSGYYKHEVDKYTGEIIFNDDFESQNISDSWYECSSCRTIMNAEWRVKREQAAERDEEDSDGPN